MFIDGAIGAVVALVVIQTVAAWGPPPPLIAPQGRVKVFVYPNAALDSALARLEKDRPRLWCGHPGVCRNCAGQPMRTRKAHPVYGEYDPGNAAPFGSPFFQKDGHALCAWFALMHALTRPGSPHRVASPQDADIFVYLPLPYDAPFVEPSDYTDADRAWLAAQPAADTTYLPVARRLRLRKSCEFLWSLGNATTVHALMPHLAGDNFRRHFVLTQDGAEFCGKEAKQADPMLAPECGAFCADNSCADLQGDVTARRSSAKLT